MGTNNRVTRGEGCLEEESAWRRAAGRVARRVTAADCHFDDGGLTVLSISQ